MPQIPTAQRERLPLDAEATIRHLAAFDSIETPLTVPITIDATEDDHIVVTPTDEAAEDPLYLDVRVEKGEARLYTV